MKNKLINIYMYNAMVVRSTKFDEKIWQTIDQRNITEVVTMHNTITDFTILAPLTVLGKKKSLKQLQLGC